MNKWGSGNMVPMLAGPSAVLEALSSTDATGTGSRRQRWRPATKWNAAEAGFGRLVGAAEPTPCVPFPGTFAAGAGGPWCPEEPAWCS